MSIKTNKKIDELLIKKATQLIQENKDETEITFPGTQIKLYLVRSGSELAAQLNEIKGAFTGVTTIVSGITFLLFRKGKIAA